MERRGRALPCQHLKSEDGEEGGRKRRTAEASFPTLWTHESNIVALCLSLSVAVLMLVSFRISRVLVLVLSKDAPIEPHN